MGLITAVLTCQGQSTVYLGMLPTVVGASSRDTVRPRGPSPTSPGQSSRRPLLPAGWKCFCRREAQLSAFPRRMGCRGLRC